MQLLSKHSKNNSVFIMCYWIGCFCFRLYWKYEFVVPVKDKKNATIAHAFQNLLQNSNCKINKMWLDKGNEI